MNRCVPISAELTVIEVAHSYQASHKGPPHKGPHNINNNLYFLVFMYIHVSQSSSFTHEVRAPIKRLFQASNCDNPALVLIICRYPSPGGGVFPILMYTCMCRANAPVFGNFSLYVRRKNVNFLSLCSN